MQAELDKLTTGNGVTGTGLGDGKKIDGNTQTNEKHHPLLLQVRSSSFFLFPLELLIHIILLLSKHFLGQII